MVESSGAARAWASALAAVAVVALLAGVYLVDRLFRLPGQAAKAGREVATELRDLATAFRRGTIETEFVSYVSELSPSTKLQVAELSQVEVFRRTESTTVLWGALRLPDVVVEARVPVEYVYYLDLEDSWRFELEERTLRVLAPRLEFNSPALDVSRLEYDIRASSILRDEDAAIAVLQAGLTTLCRRRAVELTALVRETARRQTEEFVRNWLGAGFDQSDAYSIEVLFEGQPEPGQGATLERAMEVPR